MSGTRHGCGSSSVEWNTPEEYIESARKVMGSIDLDPASSAYAQKTVKATRHFTKVDDGLTKDWEGTVFLNPPYDMPAVAEFVSKLRVSHKAKSETRRSSLSVFFSP